MKGIFRNQSLYYYLGVWDVIVISVAAVTFGWLIARGSRP